MSRIESNVLFLSREEVINRLREHFAALSSNDHVMGMVAADLGRGCARLTNEQLTRFYFEITGQRAALM